MTLASAPNEKDPFKTPPHKIPASLPPEAPRRSRVPYSRKGCMEPTQLFKEKSEVPTPAASVASHSREGCLAAEQPLKEESDVPTPATDAARRVREAPQDPLTQKLFNWKPF